MAKKTQILRARVEERHTRKLADLSRQIGLTRSCLLRLLIESAELAAAPPINSRIKNNRRDAQELSHQSITAVA